MSAGGATIIGVGARTASGLTALQVAMSARALKFAPRPSHFIDRHGEPIGTARLRSIADNVIGIDRFVALGGPALTQAAFPWVSAQASGTRMPVVIALPSESRPGFDPRMKAHLLAALEARSRVPIDRDRSELVLRCRGGGVIAFEKAMAKLRRGDCEAVAVGGIDSYFDPDALEYLDAELRLHSMETENGFVPGEGAGFVVLAPRRRLQGQKRWAEVLSAGSADEPRPYGSEEPSIGLGLTLAVKRAAEQAGLGDGAIGWALTDVANERHRVDDWSYALARNHAAFAQDVIHEQPLLKTGDLGAASAAVLLSIAVMRWDTGSAVSPAALIATASDGAERGALVATAAS
ncbi:MAG: beta-ketoacyl synthase N-terminal-like domain-containing protein [Byssovorax sp.]